MVYIEQQLVSNVRIPRNVVLAGPNPCWYITVHETGNFSKGAGAQAHADLQSRGFPAASWHLQIDDKKAIQSFRFSTRCAHAGDGQGHGNMSSIAIEVCVNPESDRREAWRKTAEVVKQLMKDHGIPLENVVQHNHWSGKNCPSGLRSGTPFNWGTFKSMLSGASSSVTPAASTPAPKKKSSGKQPYSHDQVAQEVVDGKWGNGADRRKRLEDAGFNFNSVQRRVNALLKPKSEAQVAKDISEGKGNWGNGAERTRKLQAAGYNAGNVQKRVNSILLGGNNSISKPSVNTIATQIVNGKGNWGNEPGRSQKLRNAGYDPAAVQRRVNQLLR